jgi:hypothetical protein
VTPFRCSYLADISARRHACNVQYGWRDVWISGGRTHSSVLPMSISQRALLSPYLHARMHAHNACVVRASRHVFVSGLRPQGTGSPEHLSPSPSLRFSSYCNLNNTHCDLALACQPACLPAASASRRRCLSPHPRRAGQCRATDTEHFIKLQYSSTVCTCRFRKFVASTRSLW